MDAGSWAAIKYVWWQFVDEALHAMVFDWAIGNAHWWNRFCQWAHRYDGEEPA